MTLHFFAIPALTPQPAQDEFNRFCLAHQVVNIERQFVGVIACSVCLSFCSAFK
jgi:hypothetical protein